MTYGNFYYNNWAFVQKNRWINCVNNNKTKKNGFEQKSSDRLLDLKNK